MQKLVKVVFKECCLKITQELYLLVTPLPSPTPLGAGEV